MKKWLWLVLALGLFLLPGCGAGSAADAVTDDSPGDSASTSHGEYAADTSADVIEISEKLFIAQTNDVYLNTDDYLGKHIKYQGIFSIYTDEATNTTYYSVIRYGPGCCGYDGNAGFEVTWTDSMRAYPNADDWVEAMGTLETYEEDGVEYLRLRLSSLNVLPQRGQEYVSQ